MECMEPDPYAVELSERLLEEHDVLEEILEETITSAENGRITESGRTVCPESGDRILGPLGRFDRSVNLQECPIGESAVLHSHVSLDQLTQPEHSLPDSSNVILGGVDVSIVVGTQTHDVLLAPADKQTALNEFQDALGVEVRSTDDVVRAIETGQIPDPTDARRRVKARLSPLYKEVPSDFSHLALRVQQLHGKGMIASYDPDIRRPEESISTHTQNMRQQRKRQKDFVKWAGKNAGTTMASHAISQATARAVSKLLFD